ncbi:MAG TPA: hypothetical protein VGM31_11735 [Puia sp.]|jgi:hypothetical protein
MGCTPAGLFTQSFPTYRVSDAPRRNSYAILHHASRKGSLTHVLVIAAGKKERE